MRSQQWSRAKEVFSDAMQLSGAAREEFVAEACGTDAELSAEVAGLLTSHDQDDGFLESSPFLSMESLSGHQLGPYLLGQCIGSGGMGDVYAARDLRLDREVAIKVLAPVTSDATAREHFEREARAVAALNQPHICTLYDIGGGGGIDYLVLELLKGETLDKRLQRGPLPLLEALELGAQITSALHAVHRAGMVHRDLKPANVMLTKAGAKVLDFGISKVSTLASPAIDLQRDRPNVTTAGFGTVQYMAPELFDGHVADARTDIFAFGAVLYEMITARAAFSGESVNAVIDSIRSTSPAPAPHVPARVERIWRTCLESDPDDRWQSARDLHHELLWVKGDLQRVDVPHALPSRIGRVVFIAITAAIIGAFTAVRFRPPQVTSPTVFEVATPEAPDPTAFAISPDGSRLAFVAQRDGVPTLWVRPLDQLSAKPLPGTDNATYPFWSPNSRHVAFFADGKLRRIDVESGEIRSLADAPNGRGGSWNEQDTVIYAPATAGPLLRISANGGDPSAATVLQSDQNSHRWPHFLPGGRRFIFLSTQGRAGKPGIFGAYLDSGDVSLVVEGDTPAMFAPPDQLLFVQRGALVSAQFDARTMRMSGVPQPVVDRIGFDPNLSRAAFSISNTGVLVHRSTIASTRQLTWMTRDGRVGEVVGPPDSQGLASPELSRDGTRVAFSRIDGGNADIWTLSLPKGVPTRFTFDVGVQVFPMWSLDGARLYFTSAQDGRYNLFEQRLSADKAEPLVREATLRVPNSLSTDGQVLLISVQAPNTGVDIFALRLQHLDVAAPVIQTPFDEMAAQFSPKGESIAYQSNSSGRMEVYLRAIAGGLAQQVSTTGGSQPRWNANGTELYYVAADGRMMAVTVADSPSAQALEASMPIALFDPRIATGANIPPAVGTKPQYAVAADGRFLINRAIDQATQPLRVALDWQRSLLHRAR